MTHYVAKYLAWLLAPPLQPVAKCHLTKHPHPGPLCDYTGDIIPGGEETHSLKKVIIRNKHGREKQKAKAIQGN